MNTNYYVYIITNYKNTVLYVGVTNDLYKRMYEHINKVNDGFSKTYNLKKLVYYELFSNPNEAISREKQLKNWHRPWKMNLIKGMNPEFNDLYKEWIETNRS